MSLISTTALRLYACLGGVWIVLWIIFAAETPTIRGTRLGNAFCCRVRILIFKLF